jgi:RNA polymerase sigma-70 factor (ECF subfamily)
VSRSRRARFELFYRSHYEELLAFALRRANPTEAEDIVAETFLVAWRRLAEIPEDPLPWLFGVARHVLHNHTRSHRRREALVARLGHRQSPTHADSWNPVEESLAETEILDAFSKLPKMDREVLSLVAWEGLTPARAAVALSCSPATFSVRLHRARRRLLQAIQSIQKAPAARS